MKAVYVGSFKLRTSGSSVLLVDPTSGGSIVF